MTSKGILEQQRGRGKRTEREEKKNERERETFQESEKLRKWVNEKDKVRWADTTTFRLSDSPLLTRCEVRGSLDGGMQSFQGFDFFPFFFPPLLFSYFSPFNTQQLRVMREERDVWRVTQ
jgi:hypothetical protein